MKKRVFHLAFIFLVIWLSMMLGAYAASFLVDFSLPISGRIGAILSNAFKTILGGLAALTWLYGWKKLSEFYFYWSLRRGWAGRERGA